MAMSWREAIKKVLQESEKPLHYAEISEQVLSQGYYKTDGATPDATVNAQISSSIKHDGEKSPFIRVGKGIFALRPGTGTKEPIAAKVAPVKNAGTAKLPKVKSDVDPAAGDTESPESVIRCLGHRIQTGYRRGIARAGASKYPSSHRTKAPRSRLNLNPNKSPCF